MSHDLRDADFWTPQSDDPLTTTSSEQSSDRINSLHQIFPECRAAEPDAPKNPYAERGEAEFHAPSPYSSSLSSGSPSHLSACQRIRKVVEELLETEKSYVKDLSLLFDLYLTPLQHQTFLSKHEMEALFGSLPAMLDFQRVFLQTLEEKIDLSPELSRPETPEESKKLLFSLGGSFLYYADHFKLYSGFCSNHLKVQKVLHRAKTDTAFKHFLDTRNPTNQHSASLESFLIKPVQRVLKYPLLLRELVSLTDERTPERLHLSEALKSMEKVASHINEMQKIYEEFGPVFERLTAENGAPYAQELSMGDFLLHSSVLWLNPGPSLGRIRNKPRLSLFVFKQALILVYKDPKVKRRLVSRSDLDPFRFRWLIPASAAHIRDHDVTDGGFDLVHLRSQTEGRPETLFQLSSSDVESKSLVLETLRCLLKDPPLPPPASTRRPSLNCHALSALNDHLRDDRQRRRADDDDDGDRTDQLEAQLQRLHFADQSERRDDGMGRGLKQWRRSLVEMGGLLDRDYSVQSLTSIINEDCFYNSIRRRKARPGLDLV
ncbi:rho guanine nucleotide exchange factor TIAM2-like [Eucyclogobius newberryi]|uniref:rho guanine nucleotide exchange factor TIAM2-like n=1 Tax=Eucyclogobius newberryi TaxID=166745 RepID=UPI003B5A7B56